MRIWATDELCAQSKFWHLLKKFCHIKKSNGLLMASNEIVEKKPTVVKNYGIWVVYQSRTCRHNAYKEYRDTTMNGAVHRMYQDMASRHRVSSQCIQIIRTVVVPPSKCRRMNTLQFHGDQTKFPKTHKVLRTCNKYKTLFNGLRPNLALK